MLSGELEYYLFNLGFVMIFAILGLLTFIMHMPKDNEFKGYRKSRHLLGLGFIIMSVYCVFRFIIPQEQNEYSHFWMLIFVAFVFSWLNYTSFLFLINADHKIKHHFFIDGIIPAILIIVLGTLGQLFPATQGVIRNILGLIFIAKCIWMFYIAEKEWRKVRKHLMEVYDESPNICWMRKMVWLTFLLSVMTIAAWYYPKTHAVYDIFAPLAFLYMTLKLINYYPKKIEEMRSGSFSIANDNSQKSNDSIKNISAILEPKIKSWVDNKKFCRANLSIKDVALDMGTNHSYLSKYLNNNLNTSFQVWLNTLRIEESKTILISENISIEEVGSRVGIPLSYNFSRWFKIVTGVTPFRYRQNATKGQQSNK